MIDKFLAIVVFAVCVVLMLRLLLGVRQRMKFDAYAHRSWQRIRSWAWSIAHWSERRAAARAAEDAIRRAREDSTPREGNVYKPKSFKRPPDNKLH